MNPRNVTTGNGSPRHACGKCGASFVDIGEAYTCCQAKSAKSAQTATNSHAGDYLTRAAKLMAERGQEYDKPQGERSMAAAVVAFNAITGNSLTEAEGWLLLQTLKDARQWSRETFHRDSAEDCIAYAALKAEALERCA